MRAKHTYTHTLTNLHLQRESQRKQKKKKSLLRVLNSWNQIRSSHTHILCVIYILFDSFVYSLIWIARLFFLILLLSVSLSSIWKRLFIRVAVCYPIFSLGFVFVELPFQSTKNVYIFFLLIFFCPLLVWLGPYNQKVNRYKPVLYATLAISKCVFIAQLIQRAWSFFLSLVSSIPCATFIFKS